VIKINLEKLLRLLVMWLAKHALGLLIKLNRRFAHA
jgi:hypothetical protein